LTSVVSTDTHYMSLALALAERGRGHTSPNPMVGAVVVDREGVVVGRGAHEYAGGPHAEVYALRDAGNRAAGATLYCTLEPCSHTGRTGPCAPLVAGAGIARVVVAIEDPNPLVNGAGLAYLRARGLDVSVGVLRDQAERLNRPFFASLRRARPFVTLKIALSMDGRIASGPGARTPMTGRAANRLIHFERAEVDALAVGSGTILTDDPRLTPRGAFRQRPLTRVVFDSRLRTPPTAKLLSTLGVGPVIIMSTTPTVIAAPERVQALVDAGARVEAVTPESRLQAGLERLTALGITSLVIEGGATLHAAAWDARLVDRIEMYVTPHVLGPEGVEWVSYPILGSGYLVDTNARPVGDDVRIEGYVHWPD
jgi:diaminohydroxyphosphoribosylaminopyrimidine deaminase/5-amino-6-(5-phosphoribosylamino)uracil reductase